MSRGTYLLDTNIAIGLLRHDPSAEARRESADSVALNAIIVGELYLGVEGSTNPNEKSIVDQLVSETVVLNCDMDTAKVYAQLKHDLKRRGRPIPENDLWIAATAIQYDFTLATRDKHFEVVTGLKIDGWDD